MADATTLRLCAVAAAGRFYVYKVYVTDFIKTNIRRQHRIDIS